MGVGCATSSTRDTLVIVSGIAPLDKPALTTVTYPDSHGI